MSQDKLVEIPASEWLKLRDLYADRKTQASAYYTIQNYISWHEQNSELNIKLYSLNGEWQVDGTFLINVS